MKVRIEVGLPEVMEAIRAWLSERGVPLVAVDGSVELTFRGGNTYELSKPDGARVRVEFEVDAYSSQDARVPGKPIASEK